MTLAQAQSEANLKSDSSANHRCIGDSGATAAAVSSKFGVGSQFGEKLPVWVSSVTPNWALTPILRAIVHSLKPITMESATYATNWPLALMNKALEALNLEAIRAMPSVLRRSLDPRSRRSYQSDK